MLHRWKMLRAVDSSSLAGLKEEELSPPAGARRSNLAGAASARLPKAVENIDDITPGRLGALHFHLAEAGLLRSP